MRPQSVLIRVRKSAVYARDGASPGYADAISAAATEENDTHFVVPSDEFRIVAARFAGASVRHARRIRKVAVGDLVETLLASMGITKERVQAWTRTKDCGCKARQRWLNQWGYKQQDRIERLLNKAARWYGI